MRIEYSKLITDKVCSLRNYLDADNLLIYGSYKSEVCTLEIIKDAFEKEKKVFCPKVLEAGKMEFYQIQSLDDILCGFKNIPEPIVTDHPYHEMVEGKSLMIMPMVAFDMEGNRLGYGGGFYDRYLQKFSKMQNIALAYECQKYSPRLPVEETDIKPEIIITENQKLKC